MDCTKKKRKNFRAGFSSEAWKKPYKKAAEKYIPIF
jgi:hypothetical protein